MSTRTQRPPAAPVKRIGTVGAEHRGDTGLWIRFGGYSGTSWFAPFDCNPNISASTPDNAQVEFVVGESRGRPIAVNVRMMNQ